ncbi:transglycosylase [Thiohalorhabdus denitrificans]|uniref:Membrane-bound lytic murein transglycosylase F n=1 Tax=Thiohalorhabdus denitrificans TaxID=381306 RepID=A0A0P9GN48_9GAMM|nr:membrane-bound lytic murein transglycosylase MltF [Thiohalorhabdus denitrificans]KPV41887.1 transglycosylase [Thiohalorhabdus denitrificans]SCY65475.1 membrane-bound lytic murein transglycosylase F [Thiohalorhabdus denitrificans]
MPFRPSLLLLLAALAPLSGCDSGPTNPDQKEPRTLDEIKESGKLIVLTRNAPTTWYIGRDEEPRGPEYEMARAFADHLGVEAEFEVLPGLGAILSALEDGEGDLAAAGLTPTDARKERFRFGPAYNRVTQQVVCRRDTARPQDVADLTDLDLTVVANSSYVARLRGLREKDYPELSWRESEELNTERLLHEVWKRAIDCTVADSTIVDINRRYYPELIAPFNLSREQPIAWALPASSAELEGAVAGWLAKFRAEGRLDQVHEKYYGFFEVFDYVDTRAFIRRIDQRFPQYRSYFRQAAEKHDLPYTLIAAQGYQESHWRPDARSPTGVRGIMMLTRRTAQALGVEDRLDPRQSIFGGAKYLARMKTRFSEEVTEPDRTWLALAAYNVGRAHLHDAQRLARQLDKSPHHWRDMKEVLPLLADRKYYRNLKYGYARGTEPVRYVRRIREYRHVLRNMVQD